MNFEIYIARRLKLGNSGNAGSPGMTIALTGVVLAVVVMILSVVVVLGFKNEITEKVQCLDSHIKISNASLGLDDNYSCVNGREVKEALAPYPDVRAKIKTMTLIADKPAILKTDTEFKGVQYHGVDKYFDWSYLQDRLIDGRIPCISDTANVSEVIISKTIAKVLNLKTGDRVLTYFIDSKVKVRNSTIVGIFSTDFEGFDNTMIVGNIALIQQVNGWHSDMCNYVGVDITDLHDINSYCYNLFSILAQDLYNKQGNTLYNVTNTYDNNKSFFSWLSMLDMNVVVILVLMLVVSGFTLVSALLMIILERIRMIGTLKALGCTNRSIRHIFIYLTQKLIFRALLLGNLFGLGLALIQYYFHIITLDADVYYMPYVPICIDPVSLVMLNVGVFVASYITLIGPSYVVATIKPSTTMRFE